MKLSLGITALTCGVVVAAMATSGIAQTRNGACPKGDIAIFRVNKIVPGGSHEGFKAAVDANQQWYVDQGITSNAQIGGTVLDWDQATMTAKPSADQVATIHINPPPPSVRQDDNAWKAFVKLYQDNSKMVSETYVCFDKPLR
jgi:hypothetical protein